MKKVNQHLICQINEGDRKAFEQLYTCYYVPMRVLATHYVFRIETAQELVNDVFMGLWKNRKNLRYPLGGYLVRAIQNRCINYLQRQRLREISLSDLEEHLLTVPEQLITGHGDDPLSSLEGHEFEQHVHEAVQALPPKCRVICTQYLYHNKSYNEIAELNGIQATIVRVQVRLGMLKIKEWLNRLADS